MKTKEELLLIEIKKLNDKLYLCETFLSDLDVTGFTYSDYLRKAREIDLDLSYYKDKE
jgi:hypothetical protein